MVAPRIRFLKRQTQTSTATARKEKTSKKSDEESESEEEEEAKPDEDSDVAEETTVSKKSSKLTPFQKKLALLNKKQLEKKKEQPINFYAENDEDGEDMLFKVKRVELESTEGDSTASDGNFNFNDDPNRKKIKVKTKASIVKKLKKKNIKINEKVLFDEEGNVRAPLLFNKLIIFYEFDSYLFIF